MVLGVMPEFLCEAGLSSLSMPEAVCSSGRGRNKVTEVRVKRVVIKGDKYIWAEARSWAAVNVIFEKDGRGGGFEGVKAMYPCGRFCEFVSQNVRNLRACIVVDAFAGSTSKAVTNSIVKEIVGVEMNACCSV